MVDTIDPNTGLPVTLADPTQVQESADALNNIYHPAAQQTAADNTAISNSSTFVQDGMQKLAGLAPTVAAAMLGVGKATQAFAAGLDPGKITTFSKQLAAIADATSRPGTAIADLRTGASSMLNLLSGMGKNVDTGKFWLAFASDAAGATKRLAEYAATVVGVGDEMSVLRDSIISQAAASGNLGDVLNKAGNNLKDFNNIAAEQQKIWVDTGKALGMLPEDVAKYSAELNKVPGVLQNMVGGHAKAQEQAKLFQDTLRLFRISGRSYEDITKDMTTAVMEFGTSEKGALDYTTRMSVAAKALKVPVDELHKAIVSSSAAFKMFAGGQDNVVAAQKASDDMTKNLERSMAGYIQMLRSANIPMSNAREMAENFAGAIGQMTIAQKAFISGQTGGPGGLMGAFQLDKLMDEGKIDQVFGKVQDVLRKQFGRIVTTAQAAQSQSAAEQMTRQIMILRQGPLGQFAKSDAEARKLLDAMSKGGATADMKKLMGDLKEEAPLQSFLDKGNVIAEGSQGTLNRILQTMAGGEYAASRRVADITQPGLGAATFSRNTNVLPDVQEERRRLGREGRAGEGGLTLMESTMRDLKGLPASLMNTMRALGNAMAAGDEKSIASLDNRLKNQVEEYKKAARTAPSGQREDIMRNAAAVTGAVSKANTQYFGGLPPGVTPPARTTDTESQISELARSKGISIKEATQLFQKNQAGGAGTTGGPSRLTLEQRNAKINDYMRTHPGVTRDQANAQLSSTLKDTTAPGGRATGTGAQGGPLGQPTMVTLAPGTTFSMHVTSTCTNCGAKITTPEIAKVNSTAAGISPNRP